MWSLEETAGAEVDLALAHVLGLDPAPPEDSKISLPSWDISGLLTK